MFGLKAKQQVANTTPVSIVPRVERPKPQLVATDNMVALDNYVELAKELEFMPAQLLEKEILQFFAKENIPTFDNDDVYKYLAQVAEKEEKNWIWRPLREKDKPTSWEWPSHKGSLVKNSDSNYFWHGGYRDNFDHRPYDKAIPIHILRQVKKIQDHIGDRALFFVSDYAVPDPDPFIMVTALDVKRIIFGVWDEPSFGISDSE
ncbi:MAG: hypothetical protein A3C07_03810 [Candidatus Sungbacteria bacterium RIFCSPHIGHO2_02_FULL_47_11]|uniref:Uncharacterized protein n=1 Tax=Candidatus Sungbacteria bacterium RIFCSPHIGHO2_02_FULL_47_11 TaxID=1802270 RepID=A0A1G2KMS1_9BACT|nr:MAG: hypothetical protein A3C07_03810 [Candidatus Sungbacteria bacterium RIFCSPHIGHO2_02_FULL_47_11]